MTTDQVGVVNLYSSWYSMITVVSTLALTSGGFSIALREFEKERDQYVSSVLSLTSIVAIGLALLYFVAPSFWNNITGAEIHCNATVEDYALIYTNSVIRTGAKVGHCARIGSNVTICNNATVPDGADVPDCTAVYPEVKK